MTLLKEKAVKLDVELDNAVEAIRLSGELLVETGCATEEYTQAMIDGYKRVGPISLLHQASLFHIPGLIMEHFNPGFHLFD